MAHLWYAELLRSRGRLDEAMAHIQAAGELDPLSRVIQNYRGWIAFSRSDLAAAQAEFRKAIAMEPTWAHAHVSLAYTLAEQRDYRAALAELEEARRLAPDSVFVREATGYVCARAGQKSEARRILAEPNRLASRQRVSSYDVAMIYAGLGERDAAFRWLEKGLAERDPWMIWLKVHPEWDSLRGDARLEALLRRMQF
jgi:tetratricopeptide (TPR) repeat protein